MPAAPEVLEAAIAQIEQGFAVFALGKNSKVPVTLNGFKNATTNPDWIRTQLSAASAGNYGMVWPETTPERVVVFDLDDGGGAERPWRDRLVDLVTEHGPLPRTKHTVTPSGGRHAFYRWPATAPIPPGDELFGFTVRWPGRGYLVGPGSEIDGRRYAAGDEGLIAELPGSWVTAALKEHPRREARNGAFIVVEGGFALPDRIPSGRRYAAVRDYVASRYNSGLSADELWALVKSEVWPRFDTPKTEHELRGDFERATAKIAERLGAPARGGPTGLDAVEAITPILFRNLSTIAVESVSWLWFRYLPVGSVTLFDGNPGEGKSTIVADLIARLTRGTTWPDDSEVGAPGGVLYITKEDDPATQVRPRIEVAGGDVSRVFFVAADLLFPRDLPRFREVLEELRPRLVILDPLMSYLEGKVRTVSDNEVRSALMTPLAEAARDTGCAILVIRHFNKGSGQSALLRGAGSLGGLAGAARMVLAIASDPDVDDDKARVFGVVKSNHEAKPPSLRAMIESAPVEGFQMTVSRARWAGPSTTSVGDLMERSREEHQLVLEAETTLHELLAAADEPMPSTAVHSAMKAKGHSRSAVYNAAKALRVHVDRTGYPAKTTWSLPVVTVVSDTRTTETTDGSTPDSPVNLPPDHQTTSTTEPSSSHPSQSSHISGAVASRAPAGATPEAPEVRIEPSRGPTPTVRCHFPSDHSTAWMRAPGADESWYCSICSPVDEA